MHVSMWIVRKRHVSFARAVLVVQAVVMGRVVGRVWGSSRPWARIRGRDAGRAKVDRQRNEGGKSEKKYIGAGVSSCLALVPRCHDFIACYLALIP